MINREILNKTVQDKAESVRTRIAQAAQRSGRSAQEITLVAVSKYARCDDGIIPAMVDAGCSVLGENRPQLLLEKIDCFMIQRKIALSQPVQWHFIGSLQKNKIRRILPFVSLIHSVDSIKLLMDIDRIAEEENRKRAEAFSGPSKILNNSFSDNSTSNSKTSNENLSSSFDADLSNRFPIPSKIPVLLEVNISGEESKHGFTPETLPDLFPQTLDFKRVKICGLMGMGALNGTSDDVRHEFETLRKLRDLCVRRYAPPEYFRELSMGMSSDFEIAIEEGATIVRIGSLLYP